MLGHHWPASETPWKWRFAGRPMMAHAFLVVIGSPYQLKFLKNCQSWVGPPLTNFLDQRMLRLPNLVNAAWKVDHGILFWHLCVVKKNDPGSVSYGLLQAVKKSLKMKKKKKLTECSLKMSWIVSKNWIGFHMLNYIVRRVWQGRLILS